MKKSLLAACILFISVNSQAQTDRYWSGGSGSSDNIDQGANWYGGVNPSSGDNLYFNNTVNRHWAYSNYAGGSFFNFFITYNGAGGIKLYGDNTYAKKFENNNDANLLELSPGSAAPGSREIGSRIGFDLEINPVGTGGILVSCDKISIDNQGAARALKVYGNNTLTINGSIYEKNGAGAMLQLLGAATVELKGNSLYTGLTTVAGGTLKLNATGGAIKSGNAVTISGGTVRVMQSQTIGDLNMTAGTLQVDGGTTLTITGSYNVSGGSINNLGTILLQGAALQSFPGLATLTNMNNLAISNSNSVQLSNNLTVNGGLALSTGAIVLNGNTLTLNGALTGAGTITGSATSSLVIGGTALNQSLSFTTGAGSVLKNLTLNAGATATLATPLDITAGAAPGTVTVAAGATLTSGGNLTLKSDDNGTARVATSAGTISGNVTVERNIKNASHRAWHLLSTNTSGSQTIYQSWQEGGVNNANQGTNISSNLYNGSNGFDMSSNSASILTHNQGGLSGPSWNYNLANTNSTVLSSYPGYMLFVRGDRNYTPTLPSPTATNRTVLRSTGALKQGTQSAVTVSATGTGRTLVGNPYASPIDMETVFTGTTNLNQDMYIWDPAATGNYGVGAYVLVERNGGNYQQTPYGGSATADANSRYIQSGQAFFLKATGADASVVFTENMKVASLPSVNPFARINGDQQLYVNLLLDNGSAPVSLADGIRVRFSDSYTAAASDDIEKMGNFGENISVYRNSKKWIVEKRPMISKHDTIALRLGNTVSRNYILRIAGIDFVQNNITAYLEDSYTGKRTLLNLSGPTNDISFSITADAASANPDRFRIVFSAATALPVSTIDNGNNIFIYPNPVTGGQINIRFNGMKAGIYGLRLINSMGQIVQQQQFTHSGGTVNRVITISKATPPGIYTLEMLKPDHSKMQKILMISGN